MIFSEFLNTAIGSCLIIIIIGADYLRKYNTDNFQRRIIIIILGSVFFSALFDYIGLTLERIPGIQAYTVLYYVWSIYMIARICSFYYGVAFIDYFAHGNTARTKKLIRILTAFIIMYSISLLPNLYYGYYFYISRENLYRPGVLYPLQVLLSYFPILLIFINICLSPKKIRKNQILFIAVFIIMISVGAALDIVLRTTNLIWPCMTAAILYIYFFIIRSDSNIDSLTGIGNRNSFNEYITNIFKEADNRLYAFVIINIDRFREINDILGHLEGDNALRDTASIIKGSIRTADFAARLGGDEFILVITGDIDVKVIIERIENTIKAQNKKEMRPYQIQISYAYDIYNNNHELNIQDFLNNINQEMLNYKDSHRRKVLTTITANLNHKTINNGEDNV